MMAGTFLRSDASKVRIWRPDTCACEIAYEWDPSASGDAHVQSVKACPVHVGETAFEAVRAENSEKNHAVEAIRNHAPILRGVPFISERVAAALEPDARAAVGVFRFDGLRRLVLSAPGLNRQAAQAALDARLGAGHVAVGVADLTNDADEL